jgi:hypothetical protein
MTLGNMRANGVRSLDVSGAAANRGDVADDHRGGGRSPSDGANDKAVIALEDRWPSMVRLTVGGGSCGQPIKDGR